MTAKNGTEKTVQIIVIHEKVKLVDTIKSILDQRGENKTSLNYYVEALEQFKDDFSIYKQLLFRRDNQHTFDASFK